jgi:hypothetical protein
MMTHDSFVAAAFVVAAIGMIGLVWSSYSVMRRSEALADDVRRGS